MGYDYRIVMGDLNANMLSTAQDATFIKELACELNLKLVEHGATNHVRDSHTWIDVILIDDDNIVLDANNRLATFPNTHNIIDVEIDFQSVNSTESKRFWYRDFKSITSEELLPLLDACDWSPVSSPDSGVDLRLEHLSQNVMGIVDKLAPLKLFKTLKKGLPPWVGADLADLYRQRDAVRKRYKRTRNSALREDFQSLAAVAEQRTQ